MNPYVIEMMLKEKREELLREAERQRLVAQYEASRPDKREQLTIWLADLLIKVGNKLKERYTSEQRCNQNGYLV